MRSWESTESSDIPNGVALKQGLHVEVGTPFLERIHGTLQERARAIIERRPDLERLSKTEIGGLRIQGRS